MIWMLDTDILVYFINIDLSEVLSF